MERIWANHDDEVVFAPTPEDLSMYLDNSNLWEQYTHPRNPNLNGWKFFREDDVGKEIVMPGYTIWERTAERFKSICKIESAYCEGESPALKLAIIRKGANS